MSFKKRPDIDLEGNRMSAMRKAEGHSRPAGKLHSMKSGRSKPDSEMDSGLSDAGSEHLNAVDPTDLGGSSRLGGTQRGHAPSSQQSGPGSQPSPLAVLGGSYPGLSPMILMNNVLLKQPCDPPPVLKPWRISPAVEVVPQSQVVFLQSVVSRQGASVPNKGSGKRRRPKKYLPILKSYPKIAPHPGDSSSSSGRGSLSPSPSSSSVSGSERGCSSASGHMKRRYRDKQRPQQRRLPASGSSTPSLPAPPSPRLSASPQMRLALALDDSSACGSPAEEGPSPASGWSEFSPSPSASPSERADHPHTRALPLSPPSDADGEDRDAGDPQGQKRKRFCNTYNILSKSGLLDITLRTKELLRQNRRTQNDLDRLKEDASLFVQALQTGDWGKLAARPHGEESEKEKGNERRGQRS